MDTILDIISNGEGLTVEFKRSREKIPTDVYQTICAFLNRSGGKVFLGVGDDGSITGIREDALDQMKKDLVTALNNPQKLNPPLYILPQEFEIHGKTILLLDIPESSQVHRCNNRIYDRNEDGDFNITDNTSLVAELYIRKQGSYSENRIYPYVALEDLRTDLIQRARKLARGQRPDHPWAEMEDMELLKSARLFHKDYQSGEQGFTLAAVLLFGRDDVILSVLPHHKTDVLLRVYNVDRYDDRDDIRTNLIESYDRIMGFTAKHLPDKFHLIKDQRVQPKGQNFQGSSGQLSDPPGVFEPVPGQVHY